MLAQKQLSRDVLSKNMFWIYAANLQENTHFFVEQPLETASAFCLFIMDFSPVFKSRNLESIEFTVFHQTNFLKQFFRKTIRMTVLQKGFWKVVFMYGKLSI